MSDEQVVVCEGCGSKWRVSIAKGRASVIAKLEECPLCERLEVESGWRWNLEDL